MKGSRREGDKSTPLEGEVCGTLLKTETLSMTGGENVAHLFRHKGEKEQVSTKKKGDEEKKEEETEAHNRIQVKETGMTEGRSKTIIKNNVDLLGKKDAPSGVWGRKEVKLFAKGGEGMGTGPTSKRAIRS